MHIGGILFCFAFFFLSCLRVAEGSADESSSPPENAGNSSLSLDDINRELEQADDISSDLASSLRKYKNDMQSLLSQITEETSKGKDGDKNRIDQLTKEYEEAKQKAKKVIDSIRNKRADRNALPTDLPQRTNIENVGSGTDCPIHKKKRRPTDVEEEKEDSQAGS